MILTRNIYNFIMLYNCYLSINILLQIPKTVDQVDDRWNDDPVGILL